MRADAEQPGQFGLSDETRDSILSDPSLLLEDAEVMRALIAANDRAMGENIVDLRGAAMRRLEGRLDRLEETHRSVIAAAYENLAGTNLVHRAVLQLQEPLGFDSFLTALSRQVMQTLRVDSLRLVLESHDAAGHGASGPEGVLLVTEAGFVARYFNAGRDAPPRPVPLNPVLLRKTLAESARVHGARAESIGSEAALRLDLGAGRLPGLLVLGAEDPQQFRPAQGTDLLGFLARSFELTMRRWLS